MNIVKKTALGIFLIVLPIVVALVSFACGRYEMSVFQTVQLLFEGLTHSSLNFDNTEVTVLFNLRVPRVLLAALAGAGLAVSGAAFQSLFTNPLATPDTLGVASGASFGAVLAIMLGFNLIGIQLLAFLFGLIAVGLAYQVGMFQGKRSIISIILAGIVISALFSALISLLKYLADPQDVLPSITYWLMGSLSRASYPYLALGAPVIILGCACMFFMRWKLNALSLDEDEATSLGINVKRSRAIIIVAATLVTASCVSMCGQIGWVGLVVPHISRMIFGSDNRLVIPTSISFGIIFMIVMDTLSRSLSAAELPVSILTALVGAPLFIVLIKKTGGNW